MINYFCKIYEIDKQQLLTNELYYFRYICYKYNDFMKYIELPPIASKSYNEAVLIEFRSFPHLEFLIRNTIIKLGSQWAHTIVCGNSNYQFIIDICKNISSNINIIKVNVDNMLPYQYSKFLTSLSFWNMLNGEKILIYQEDSIIFNKNIDDFINFDFIGAPFPRYQNDTPNGVGNGGFSLRTKSVMIKILNTITVKQTAFNSSTIEYMEKQGLKFPPEDVYYSKNAQELGIGFVADYDSATLFSRESIFSENSFGGHKFWLSDSNWKNNLKICFNYSNYTWNSDINLYLNYCNLDTSFSKIETNKNAFDVDLYFCNIINDLHMDNAYDVIKYIHLIALDGYIYHPKQIINIFPNIKIYTFMDNIFIMYKLNIFLANDFVKKFLYNNDYDNLTKILIKNRFYNLDPDFSNLLLLVFVGNEERGLDLIDQIIEYKNIQTFNVAFCFNFSSNIAEKMKNIIKDNFEYYAVYESKEFGTDITPTLLMYDDINNIHQFDHIIKLQTKSIINQYLDLTSFMLDNNLETLLKLKIKNCNCIGHSNYYISLSDDKFNNELKLRFINELNITYSFVGGTIFYCPSIVFIKTIEFMKDNYKSYLFNNLYENNSININNSPIHFLERVFGAIKC
jgi:hypothetical protein